MAGLGDSEKAQEFAEIAELGFHRKMGMIAHK
jgi:hypothetical protein